MATAAAKKPRKRRSGLPTVERKIHFYRIDCGKDEAGKLLTFDPAPALKHVDGLAFDDGRYLPAGNGAATVMWVDQLQKQARVRIGNVRRSGLPSIEKSGTLTPLKIPDGAGIAEQTHFVFFPNNIVGVEFNFYGPRASRLITYLMIKASDRCPEFELLALLRQDIKERVNRLQDITLFHLKMLASYADVISKANEDLASSFKAAAKAGDADELEIILRAKRHRKGFPRQGFLRQGLKRVAQYVAETPSLQQGVSKFELKGMDSDTGQLDLVDVLSDDLIAKRQVVLQDSRLRSVNTESAYEAIIDAYSELRDDLLKAAGVKT